LKGPFSASPQKTIQSPLKTVPQTTPTSWAKIPFTPNSSFGTFNPPKSDFLSNFYQILIKILSNLAAMPGEEE